MALFDLVMPKLGESIIEATITKWMKNVGDIINEDDPIVEIATDKVDSEIPSPVEGKLAEVLFNEGDVVAVGTVIARIEMDMDAEVGAGAADESQQDAPKPAAEEHAASAPAEKAEMPETSEQPKGDGMAEDPGKTELEQIREETPEVSEVETKTDTPESGSDRFYSPLVKNMAKAEGIPLSELDSVKGRGKDGRVTKEDFLEYLKTRSEAPKAAPKAAEQTAPKPQAAASPAPASTKPAGPKVIAGEGDEIVEMDRMRKLIADHMVMSVDVSPHVTSYIEVDVTHMVQWREKVKDEFQKREKEKLTFTPLLIEAAAKALKEHPGVNASVDGYNVILRKNINIGMAAALPSGNLIVPVIKNADQKNLIGLAKDVNSLASKARNNKLEPDDIQSGTFTVTNLGTFGSITGSPIINQPQVAILGLGVIKKKPVVLETPQGDVIAIRHMMILSLSYDHRVVDGALGGMYLQTMQRILESFNPEREI